MDFTLTFEQVVEDVHKDDQTKWDTLVSPREIMLFNGRITLPEECYSNTPSPTGSEPFALLPSPWATGQLCQRLGIPTAYFRRCPSLLQDSQVNYWIRQPDVLRRLEQEGRGSRRRTSEPEKWLLRAKADTLRGVLSDRYAAMDNASLLSHITPLLEARLQVGWFALSQESLHLRLVDPGLSRDVLPGDRLFVGIHIANSEVGRRAVTVDAMVFRLVCTNGLIRLVEGKSLLHQRHLYLSQPRFAGALQDAVSQALSVASIFLDQLAHATHLPVRDIEATVKALASQWGLSEDFAKQVKVALLKEPASQQETVYGLVNALTSAAHDLTVDERYRIEALAGRLIDPVPIRSTRLVPGAENGLIGPLRQEALLRSA